MIFTHFYYGFQLNQLLGTVAISDKSAKTIKQTVIRNMEWNLFHKPTVVRWLNQNYYSEVPDGTDKNAASLEMKLGKMIFIILLIFWTLICL